MLLFHIAMPTAVKFSPRIMQKARRDYGQEFWWTPGDPTPARAPDLEAAVAD